MKASNHHASGAVVFSSPYVSLFFAASLGVLLAACGPNTPPDRYDQAKMDLKPVAFQDLE